VSGVDKKSVVVRTMVLMWMMWIQRMW